MLGWHYGILVIMAMTMVHWQLKDHVLFSVILQCRKIDALKLSTQNLTYERP